MSERSTVLLVEDDPDLLRFAQVSLRLGGYRTMTATNGVAAVALARKAHPHLMVLDLRIPQLDGWQVLQTLRATPEMRAVPVLVLTASAGPDERERALAAGVADYLVKPVSADALLAAVDRALGANGH